MAQLKGSRSGLRESQFVGDPRGLCSPRALVVWLAVFITVDH